MFIHLGHITEIKCYTVGCNPNEPERPTPHPLSQENSKGLFLAASILGRKVFIGDDIMSEDISSIDRSGCY